MRRQKRSFLLRLSPTGQRRLFGAGIGLVALALTYWTFFSDGLPIFWGPSASAAEIAEGRDLFEHEWTPSDPLAHGDGLGPVFNARSCGSCHFQGGLGGGGGIEHNAMTFEVHSRSSEDDFRTGTVHNFSVDPAHQESISVLRKVFPIVKGRTTTSGDSHCPYTTTIPDFDPVRTQSVQATALFGVGWIDLISDRAILRNARNRGLSEAVQELSLNFKSVPAGRVRQVSGGVGKFGWKAQFSSLSDFVAAACANELGLGTPSTEQSKPLTAPGVTAAPDLDRKQFRSLVSFVKTLPKPIEEQPDQADTRDAAVHGKALFSTIGCAICHVPDLGGVKGVFSDFLLYTLDEPQPPGGGNYGPEPPSQLGLSPRPDSDPRADEWKTPALWGVANSAPYLHDGSAATLRDAILRHHGDAKRVTEGYKSLGTADQNALITFLETLKAPPEAPKLRDPSTTQLYVRRN